MRDITGDYRQRLGSLYTVRITRRLGVTSLHRLSTPKTFLATRALAVHVADFEEPGKAPDSCAGPHYISVG
jgi:hypothetical protein